ncbi:hypothetical protein AB0L88_09400 [Saccharopolyspora shandongensis]|uniref:hypothetical protein n=1 Tax=Saccharopolyspora shandongensis TaxID=418495 RepID=UPI0034271755
MKSEQQLLPFPKRRVLEDAAFGQGLNPTMLFSLLLPVYEVEVETTTRYGRDYALIDKFAERAIAEGQVTTESELVQFLKLDALLVDRAVRVLERIGHLTRCGPRLELTALARESLRDNTCYEDRRHDRRKLYFDAYRCQPLHRRYYESESVTFLNRADLRSPVVAEFSPLGLGVPFRPEVLERLGDRDEREKYNLPIEVENPHLARPEFAYLPVYVVRALDRGAKPRYLVYGQAAGGELDQELSALCQHTPEITAALENEIRATGDQQPRIKKWLDSAGLRDRELVRFPDGSWRVSLLPGDFKPAGNLRLSEAGSFIALRAAVVRMWCGDAELRHRALFERVETFLHGFRARPAEVPRLIRQIGAQLRFGDLDVAAVRTMALSAGRTELVERLDEFLRN